MEIGRDGEKMFFWAMFEVPQTLEGKWGIAELLPSVQVLAHSVCGDNISDEGFSLEDWLKTKCEPQIQSIQVCTAWLKGIFHKMYILFLFVTSLTLPLNDCTLYSLAFDQNKFISSADQSPLLFCSKSTFQTDQFIKLLNEYNEAWICLFFSTLDSEKILHHFWSY